MNMSHTNHFTRITLIVLDGAGIGEMPDAEAWGDKGSDTFGHILESRSVRLPNLQRLVLGNNRRDPTDAARCVRMAKIQPRAIGKWRG